ncbi:MAG: YeeE/YedE family protein [Myxococcales bacterium]|nr:YeeE/YedE family protein [Myxococcales bacterium]
MDDSRTAAISGLLFGAGLTVSQMTNPAKVMAFLDVTGSWDPTLAFVMGGALLVSAIAVRVEKRRSADSQPSPSASIDARLLSGAVLFGLGWGLAGFCPGPALAALATGSGEVLLFVVSMIAGMGLFEGLQRGRATAAAGDA